VQAFNAGFYDAFAVYISTLSANGALSGPPSVYIDTPAPGTVLSGMVTVAGWAIDNTSAVGTAISSVQVFVDGEFAGTATYGVNRSDVCAVYPGRPGCPNVGFTFNLDVTALSPGTHTITVYAADSDVPSPDVGSSASITVTVSPSGGAPSTPPYVNIDLPGANEVVSGIVSVSGWAIDNIFAVGSAINPGSVQVKVDGVLVGTATYGVNRSDVCAVYPGRPGCPNVGFNYSLDTTALSPGSHTITVYATDTDIPVPGVGSASVTVTVSSGAPSSPPYVNIDFPGANEPVSGSVTVSGWAIDNISAIGSAINPNSVQVKVDGVLVGTATYGVNRSDVCSVYPGRLGCPNVGFTYSLDTTAFSPGTHTITVLATDTDTPTPETGSNSVTVIVSGAAPHVNIDLPGANEAVSGTILVTGWALDNLTEIGTAINPNSLQVKVDGYIYGSATYGGDRSDVCAVYPGRVGCPNVGFNFELNTAPLSPGAHTITVSATDTDAPTPDTGSANVTVNVGGAVRPSVYIDLPGVNEVISGTVSVVGWAIDNTSAIGTAINPGSLQVLVDGLPVGTAIYGSNRADVCDAYPGRPGCPNVGYTFSLNTLTLSNGPHTITVWATDTDSTPDTGSASINVTVQN
jgi:N-acetylmuramoyl-L-alanine amidase